jgi:hypothetical protein
LPGAAWVLSVLELDVNTVWAATLKWTRTVHIYLTLAAMLLLLFFAATGFLMNHEAWFKPASPQTINATATVPMEMLKGDRLTIVEYLRAHLGAAGEAKFSEKVKKKEGEKKVAETVQFRSPGQSTEFAINMETGETGITRQSQGTYGVLTDMHRGKQSTAAWKLLTDVTAFSVAGAVITGFVMWLGMKRRRLLGIVGLAISAAVAVTLFVLAVR